MRHRLIPYIYSEAYKYHKVGLPLIQPLYYQYPEIYDEVDYKNEYYFGSELFVAPITKPKDHVMNRSVEKIFLPKGTWYDFKTGKKYLGNKRYILFYKDEDYPIFVTGDFNDYIGADTKSVLMAWQNMSYNVRTEKVGSLDVTPYKKDCYLIEYTPDYRKVRTWRLYGCWISSLTEGEYTAEDGGKHNIDCTIQYDRAEIDLTEVI